jgi:hypothetical protein
LVRQARFERAAYGFEDKDSALSKRFDFRYVSIIMTFLIVTFSFVFADFSGIWIAFHTHIIPQPLIKHAILTDAINRYDYHQTNFLTK